MDKIVFIMLGALLALVLCIIVLMIPLGMVTQPK